MGKDPFKTMRDAQRAQAAGGVAIGEDIRAQEDPFLGKQVDIFLKDKTVVRGKMVGTAQIGNLLTIVIEDDQGRHSGISLLDFSMFRTVKEPAIVV